MLPKQNRLKKDGDFEKVFQKGRGFKKGLFYVKIVSNDFSESRFGIIVSKKSFKKAVARNKAKRAIREFLKREAGKMKKGVDCAIVVLENGRDGEKKDIVISDLKKALEKAGLYEKKQ